MTAFIRLFFFARLIFPSDCNGMNDETMITEMYSMIKTSAEKSARIEATVSFMSTRLEKTENLIAKMTDTLNEHRRIAEKVEALQAQLSDSTARLDALEKRSLSVIKRYVQIFITALVTSAAGFVAMKWGLK